MIAQQPSFVVELDPRQVGAYVYLAAQLPGVKVWYGQPRAERLAGLPILAAERV